jgi:hypothetical protein
MKATETQFNVHYSFSIPLKNWYVLVGSVTKGFVKSGMISKIPLNSAFSIPLKIDSIEFIDGKEGSLIGLTYKYEDEDELEILEALDVKDELISIISE